MSDRAIISAIMTPIKVNYLINNALGRKMDLYQPVEQAGFRKRFSTIDHLQTLRTLIEKATLSKPGQFQNS